MQFALHGLFHCRSGDLALFDQLSFVSNLKNLFRQLDWSEIGLQIQDPAFA